MNYTYDNSTGNVRNPNHPPRRVMYGPQTTDEMSELWLQVLARNRDDRETLAKHFRSKMQNVFFEQYQLLTRTRPGDAEAHNGLAKALLGLGQENEAIKHFRAALEIRPDYEEPHFILGYIFRAEKKLQAAEAEYQTVIRINPGNYEAIVSYGPEYDVVPQARSVDQRPPGQRLAPAIFVLLPLPGESMFGLPFGCDAPGSRQRYNWPGR
jgi:tetratricopeptide (TPR) repeat protein